MKKITVRFQDENSTEFSVDASGVTYRELLVLARALPEWPFNEEASDDKPTVEINFRNGGNLSVHTTGPINAWRLQLVADEFHLAAMHQFFAIQNQALLEAAAKIQEEERKNQGNKIAIAKLQQGGRRNSGFVLPGQG